MLGLFIDTVSPTNLVFLFENEKVLQKKTWVAKQDEAEKLLPTIRDLLKKQKESFADLGLVVTVTGPGKFTSTRVGIMVANTLSMLLDIPIAGIDRLHLLAWKIFSGVDEKDQKKLFPIKISLDSGRGDVFQASFRKLPEQAEIILTELDQEEGSVTEKVAKVNNTPLEKAVFGFLKSQKKFSKNLLDPVYVRQPNISQRKKR